MQYLISHVLQQQLCVCNVLLHVVEGISDAQLGTYGLECVHTTHVVLMAHLFILQSFLPYLLYRLKQVLVLLLSFSVYLPISLLLYVPLTLNCYVHWQYEVTQWTHFAQMAT